MVLMERYQKAVDDLFAKVRATQTEKIQEAGELIANADNLKQGLRFFLVCCVHELRQVQRQGLNEFVEKLLPRLLPARIRDLERRILSGTLHDETVRQLDANLPGDC